MHERGCSVPWLTSVLPSYLLTRSSLCEGRESPGESHCNLLKFPILRHIDDVICPCAWAQEAGQNWGL